MISLPAPVSSAVQTHDRRLFVDKLLKILLISLACCLLLPARATLADNFCAVWNDKRLNNGFMDRDQSKMPKSVRNLLRLGLKFAESGRLDQACEAFQKAVLSFKRSPALYHNLGVCAEVSRDFDRALIFFKKADVLSTRPEELIGKALRRVRASINRRNKVEPGVRRPPRLNNGFMDRDQSKMPKSVRNLLRRGLKFAESGRLGRACEDFQKAVSSFKQSPALYHNLGVCAEVSGDFNRALTFFKKADSLSTRPEKLR